MRRNDRVSSVHTENGKRMKFEPIYSTQTSYSRQVFKATEIFVLSKNCPACPHKTACFEATYRSVGAKGFYTEKAILFQLFCVQPLFSTATPVHPPIFRYFCIPSLFLVVGRCCLVAGRCFVAGRSCLIVGRCFVAGRCLIG